ncbi:hypothetical protein E4T56_gene20652 [Termitomyces sp. T112]|nr:hypothetical protein E4T56_gene20652 [Termitomyces sp. T112]
MPAAERSRVSDSPAIPRPPNSWILYRSDMVALLAPPPPGTTRSQADVSRLISTMWKTEKSEVKAEYERRAEVKKLEHAAMYPNYRYMPKSKEFKEELKKAKEERKKKKNKREGGQGTSEGSRSQAPRDLPFTSHAYPFLPADSSQYVQGGLSPPMSAAGSPSPEPSQLSLPQPITAPSERVIESVAHSQGAKSCYRPQTTISQPGQQHPAPQQPTVPLQPPTVSHYRTSPVDSPAQQHELYFPPQLQHPPLPQPEQSQDQQYALLQNNSVPPTPNNDYLSFELQQFAADSIEQWGLQNPEFQPTLGLFFNNTSGDCYQLQINSLAHGNLYQTPAGPIEVEVGQVDFDFSQWQHSHAVGALEPLFNAPQENASFENTAGPSSQTSESSFEGSDLPSSGLDQGFQLDQYINFNPTFDYAGSSPSIEEDTMAPARAPYVPPSGAAHVGKRRVAGSWNTSYAIQDPIDV